MFRKYIFLILFCILSSFAAQSQKNVPGYLGKKAFVDYNFNAPFLLYLGPKWNNFMHNVNFNYVIRRRAQIGLTVDFFNLHAIPSTGIESINGEKIYSSVSGGGVGVNFDWYSKKSIAPVGNYFRLSVKKLFGQFEDYDYGNGTSFIVDGDYDEFALEFGYGIRRIFFDQMVFNVGGTFGFIPGGRSDGTDERGYAYAVASSYIWRLHVGVGVLLF